MCERRGVVYESSYYRGWVIEFRFLEATGKYVKFKIRLESKKASP